MQVLKFSKSRPWKENGLAKNDSNGHPICLDRESIEAESPAMLPLSDR